MGDLIHLLQRGLRGVGESLNACEKMTALQQEVWELQRCRLVSLPESLSEKLSHTIEKAVVGHVEDILEEVEPHLFEV